MAIRRDSTTVLAGDIGGTKTNLGLFVKGERRPKPKVTETYASRDAPDLEHIIERFMGRHRVDINSACFGIAGPVVNGKSKTTNLPWVVSEDKIKNRFKWSRVSLVNDLTATAYAVPLMSSRELFSLNKARVRRAQTLALVAPGTGLGEALLIFQNGHYVPISSEGGHVDFAPTNEEEIALWQYLHRLWGHVSVERVLSGPGLVNIYSWLKETARYREPAFLAGMMRETDPAKAITQGAMAYKNPMCVKALNIFVAIFGAVAGNLALTGMTTGGVYLGGGISPKILPKLKEGLFMKAFTDKGRFKTLLENIPVRVILNDKAALLGAAHHAFEMER